MTAERPAPTLEPGAARVPFLWRRVCALGIAQIVSWGTLFYTIAVLGAAMRADTGVDELWLFGSFTVGLFVSGIVSPLVGREIDAHGGRRVLVAGSLAGALACGVLASAPPIPPAIIRTAAPFSSGSPPRWRWRPSSAPRSPRT